MGLLKGAEKLVNKWQEMNKKADEMGVPPMDHVLGVSIPGITYRIDPDDDAWFARDPVDGQEESEELTGSSDMLPIDVEPESKSEESTDV